MADDDTTKKPEVIHVEKFDKGRSTPDEMHRKLSYGGKRCAGCGSNKPAIRIRVLMTAADLMKENAELAGVIMAMNRENPGRLPTIETKYGGMVLVSDCVFCDICKTGAERAAAHPPRYAKDKVIVEIDRMGLSATHRPVVQSRGIG